LDLLKWRNAMRIALTLASGLSALAAAAVLVPTAAAAPMPQPKICASGGAGSTCQSAGNVEIHIPVRPVDFHPYGYMPYLTGGH
jgi:hypothetical protein